MNALPSTQTSWSVAAGDASGTDLLHPAAVLGLILCIVAFWMLQHPYEGVVHDSVLYAFQALARIHPESLGHDVYLSVGVQDKFTIFSPLAAALIRTVGLERAAQIITFTAQAGFFAMAWALIRRLMSLRLALLSLGLLVMLPPMYGDRHIFSYVEGFMTPRLPAEVFALASIAAALGRRHLLSGVLLLLSLLLHPLMAMAAIVLLLALSVALPKPRLTIVLTASGLTLLAAVAWLTPFGPISRFSASWWHMMYTRGDYLFVTRWPWLDWAHVTVPLTTLAVGSLTASNPFIRAFCRASLLTGLGGLALALIGGDLLHIVVIVQGQPWRWLWLSNALAVMVIPVIARDCWRAGDPSRITVVLQAAAWVCIDESYGPLIAALSVVAAAFAPQLKDSRQTRLLLNVAWAILAIGILALAGFVLSVMREAARITPDSALYDSEYLLALRHWKPWESGGIVPACVLLLAWWVARRYQRMAATTAILALGTTLSFACVHFAWNAWTRIDYPERLYTEFAPWRAAIPPTAEVLWLGSAFPVWYLLERPSYWSNTQMSASVYSEEMARALARRELILNSQHTTGDPQADLHAICKNNPALGFFVGPVDMGPTAFPPVEVNKNGFSTVRLYRCADYRKST